MIYLFACVQTCACLCICTRECPCVCRCAGPPACSYTEVKSGPWLSCSWSYKGLWDVRLVTWVLDLHSGPRAISPAPTHTLFTLKSYRPCTAMHSWWSPSCHWNSQWDSCPFEAAQGLRADVCVWPGTRAADWPWGMVSGYKQNHTKPRLLRHEAQHLSFLCELHTSPPLQ